MKKLFLLLALMGMVAVGCSKDEVDKGNDNKTEQPNENDGGNENDIPENIFFGLDKESVTISPDGGSVDVVVYSNYKWEISGTSDWCTPSVKGGDANEDGQKVTFSADVAYDDRETTFWFRCADEKIKFVVSQKLKAVIIPDANNSFNIPAEGGIAVISYQTSVDCEVIIPEEAQDWITIAPATRGLVRENINLDIAENTTYDSRSAVIKVVAKDNAELAVEYTINQVQNDAILADNNTFTLPSEGGNIVIDYQTNVDCEIIIPEEAQDWITIVPETRGLVAQSATLHIAENTTYDSRSAVIKVVAKDNAELVVEYTINQEQNDAILADENNTFTVPSAGGEVVIKYQTNIDCDVIIPEEAQDWITIVPETRGLSTYSTTLNVAENTTYSARTAVIKVVAKDNAELAIEYTINQEQNDAFIADENNVFTIPGPGGEVVIKYQTNIDCNVVIPEEAQDWITIVPATRGLVAYNTTLNIAANYSNKQRSCVVKVVSRDYSELFAEYTITQNLMYCLCYTSSNGNVVQPYKNTAFDATILSNTYKDGVGIIEFNAPITQIGDYAFYNCSSLTSITIPDSVTTIGNDAFEDCSSLTSVTIPDSVTTIGDYAFRYCSSLTSVTIPNNVTTIGNRVFYNCRNLTSVTIPDSVTSIGEYAFYECSSLTSVTIPDSVTTIGERAFYGCTGELVVNCNIPSASSYQYGAFYGSKFTSVTIGDSVTTIGYRAFYGCSSLTSVTIPDSVTTIGKYAFENCTGELVVNCNIPSASSYQYGAFYGSKFTSVAIGDSVTTIGNYAFEDCSSLTIVTIGDSVTTIGDYAFYECSSLTSVTIPDRVTAIGDYAFYYCSSLTSVTIPDSVTTIGDNAFYYCSSLTSVTIPDSVTTIGKHAFIYCSSLTEFNGKYASEDGRCLIIDGTLTSFAPAVLTEYTIPNSVTSIGNAAFAYCDSLTSVTIPDSVTTIGEYAFYGCSSLTSVTIPDSVTTIGEAAFYNCNSLKNVTIPDSVTTIGDYAFYECSSLTSVTIPDSVTTIGDHAFYNCSSLTIVTIGDSVTTIGDYAFFDCTGELVVNCNIPSASYNGDGAFYKSKFTKVTIGDSVTTIGDYAFYDCSSLTSVTIPDSVTTIGNGAFEDCSSLTSVTIPDSVTMIGDYAFKGCTGELIVNCNIPSASSYSSGAFYESKFTKVTIGDSVTTIGDYAFSDCSSLTSVTIPDSVTTIGSYAFAYCSSLISVYCKAVTPPTGGSYMFYSNASDRKIYVPMESVEAYKSASYWSNYKSYIVGYDF